VVSGNFGITGILSLTEGSKYYQIQDAMDMKLRMTIRWQSAPTESWQSKPQSSVLECREKMSIISCAWYGLGKHKNTIYNRALSSWKCQEENRRNRVDKEITGWIKEYPRKFGSLL